MATYKRVLKDCNGNTILPALGEGQITSTDIADGGVKSNNIDWTTLQNGSSTTLHDGFKPNVDKTFTIAKLSVVYITGATTNSNQAGVTVWINDQQVAIQRFDGNTFSVQTTTVIVPANSQLRVKASNNGQVGKILVIPIG